MRKFSRDELKHLKYLLKTRDGMTEEESTEHIANLIESQKTLPTPLKSSPKPFQEEFKKLKESSSHKNFERGA